ncbi:unnamed protein product [Adineta ricciae]|uniref:Uncharacterized protein n=1 Tax=Adineta ricciae TaxID=249248 RepID=A0A814PNE5_ADIRI|nr:unnamed protein product [Adineta ricciae]
MMSSTRKIKPTRAIDHREFEAYVRANLEANMANTILLTIGIRSYAGILQVDDFNIELLNVRNAVNEKEQLELFVRDSASSIIEVKPAILRELKAFQRECERHFNNPNGRVNSAVRRAAKTNQKDSKVLQYREKPVNNENYVIETDWSFNNEDILDYDAQFHGSTVASNFNVKEIIHVYVTSQQINHFFEKNMKITAQEIQKFIFLLQHNLAWHIENLYEFALKIRTNHILYRQFTEDFGRYSRSKPDMGLQEKCQWLVTYIKKTSYKPSGYGQ